MRIPLATAILLSATFGPICPLQMAYAAPVLEGEVLMSLAGPMDLQTCAPQEGASIGQRSWQDCPTDRCLATSEEHQPTRDLALNSPLTIKDSAPSTRFHVNAGQAVRSQLSGVRDLFAFTDTSLHVVRRE